MLHKHVKLEGLYNLQSAYSKGRLETIINTRQYGGWSSLQKNLVSPQQWNSCAPGFIRAEFIEQAGGTWTSKWSPMSIVHSRGDVVVGKYKIIGILGQGGVATTYEAETENGGRVALKAMSLRSMKGWKDLDLFEREAHVLKALKHPGIPEYIDCFEVDSITDRVFYIVQMVAEGSSLAQLVQNGWHATEEEVKRIAIEVLEILQYLGSLRPPVIHRDVKPENIILDETSGKVKLVDFGAVQDAAAVTLIGSTIVGTYGYMAPEQFQNRATVVSDLYGLGCTILYLVSGHPPSSFPQKRLKIEFQDSLIMDCNLKRVLERLLEPVPEDRFQSATEAIQALKNGYNNLTKAYGDTKKEFPRQRVRQPLGTKVVLKRTASTLVIEIPPVGFTADAVGSGTFALAWNAFLMFWTRSVMIGGASLVFTLFSLPFWFVGVRLAKESLLSFAVSVNMQFDLSRFCIQWRVGNLFRKQIEGNTNDINAVKIAVEGEQNGQVITSCQILEGTKHHKFGSGLEIVELDWLVQEISEFLELGPPNLGEDLQKKNIKNLGKVVRQSSEEGSMWYTDIYK